MTDAFGLPRSAVLLGTSDIGLAIVEALASRGLERVVLAGRDRERIAACEAALAERKLEVDSVRFDAADLASHEDVVRSIFDGGRVDLVVVSFGVFPDQLHVEESADEAVEVLTVNFTAAASVLLRAAARLRSQGRGTIVVLSSVAGQRARRGNFVYGSTKAALDFFARGLAQALRGTGVHVMVVRPGFVHSRMTEQLDPRPFPTTPAGVAREVVRGLERRSEVVWVPSVLRWVFLGVKILPAGLFGKIQRAIDRPERQP